ncbi:hypothetical protein PVA44_02295 [Entomospira nematocerorum]|uniref:Uncharacterized protein n=1 Tax=Entomospira nematocerorum TaxID=2719987 RepID=A0A968GC37_9SPIO|nr:hypothetical protein [Entomospira nematocera]NIZ47137.1 hypothetical protein [Entomospira nematocera]WDI34319.1 hypothetical protein PVA44_02295 [Entomospira nematocera]
MTTGDWYKKVMEHQKVMKGFTITMLEDILNERFLLINDEGFHIIDDGDVEKKLVTIEELNEYLNEAVGLVTLEKAERRTYMEERGVIQEGQYIDRWDFMEKWDSQMIKVKLMVEDPEEKSQIIQTFLSMGVLLEGAIIDEINKQEFYQKLYELFHGDIPDEKFLLITNYSFLIIEDFEIKKTLRLGELNNYIDFNIGVTNMKKLKFKQFLEKWELVDPDAYVKTYPFMEKWDAQELPIKMMIEDPEKKVKIIQLFREGGVWLGGHPFLERAKSYRHLKLLEYFDGDVPDGKFLLILDEGFYRVEDMDIKEKLATDEKIKSYLQEKLAVSDVINIEMKVKDPVRKAEIKQSFLAMGLMLNDK